MIFLLQNRLKMFCIDFILLEKTFLHPRSGVAVLETAPLFPLSSFQRREQYNNDNFMHSGA